MSVDYGVRVIYGYQLDQEFVEKMIKEKEDFDVYEWKEDLYEQGNCEIMYENHYIGITDWRNTVYFGIPFYNKITVENLQELRRIRLPEIQDEFIRIFGSYDLLAEDQDIEPEIHAVGVLD